MRSTIEIGRRLRRATSIAAIALLALLGTQASAARAADLSGCWEGCWVSDSTGHKGPLKARFTRIDATHYRADFRGRFFKILPFRYSVVLNICEEGDVVRLAGSSYLGRLFGTFRYDASATACDFTSNYCSRKDRGRFVLRRAG